MKQNTKLSSVWLELEQSVIGGVMLDTSVLPKCEISASDFMTPRHRLIWECITRQYSDGGDCDALTLAELLDRSDQLEMAGGLPYLATLCRETISADSAPSHAKRLRELSVLKQAHQIGQQLTSVDDVSEVDRLIADLIALSKGTYNHSCHIADAMSEALELMEGDVAKGIPTGMKDLDHALGGMHDEDLIIVAARPAAGKTAFMINLMLSSSKPVGVISGEQGRGQIGMRSMAIDKRVSLHRMRTGELHDDEWARVTEALNEAKNKKIWLFDKPGPSIEDVIKQARSWKYEHDIGVLMVDYLQKLEGGAGDDMRLRMGYIVSQLKNLGRELKIPVVVLAQVKREVESRSLGENGLGRMPNSGDIAESGIIENEADIIMTLYRPEVYLPDEQFRGLAYANICKNRHGPVGYKKLAWRGEYLQFGDIAYQETLADRWGTVQ